MSVTPAGWYDDGQHPGQQRWWDGVQWTDQFQPVAPPAVPVPPVPVVPPVPDVPPVAVVPPVPYPSTATSDVPTAPNLAYGAPAAAVPVAPIPEPVEDDTPPFRLRSDETVLDTFAVTRKRRALGTVSSTLYVTGSRVVYAARAHGTGGSSTHLQELQVSSITGVEVTRKQGLDALGIAAAVGAVLNFLGLVIAAIVVAVTTSSSYSLGGFAVSPLAAFGSLGWVLGGLAAASLVLGAAVVLLRSRPSAAIRILGPHHAVAVAERIDYVKLFLTIALFVVFGAFAGTALVLWGVARELGAFRAKDAEQYANPAEVDRLAHELGSLILDVQAGTLPAGEEPEEEAETTVDTKPKRKPAARKSTTTPKDVTD